MDLEESHEHCNESADAAKHLSFFECSLVKWKWNEQFRRIVHARALLGYMDREAAKELGATLVRRQFFCSQASDSMWRMPGHTEAMKAVVSCDKPGGAAHTH